MKGMEMETKYPEELSGIAKELLDMSSELWSKMTASQGSPSEDTDIKRS